MTILPLSLFPSPSPSLFSSASLPFTFLCGLVSLLRPTVLWLFSSAVLERKGTLTLTRTSICPFTNPFVRTFVRTWFHSDCDANKIVVDIYWMRNDVAEQGTTPTLLNHCLCFFSSDPSRAVHHSLGSFVDYVDITVTRILSTPVGKTFDSILICYR